MKTQHYNDIVTDELLVGTLDHDAYHGFLEDYRVLSCLLKTYTPRSIFEVGTNVGSGINVMRAALPEAKIYSLDLDYETMKQNSLQYPIDTDGTDRVGSAAKDVDYTQLRGDSMEFDFKTMPCEAYFVDGEHDHSHAYHETMQVLSCKPKLIVWHDSDMEEVMNGILDAFKDHREEKNYQLYRVLDTRISYAVRNEK
jgi:predicted O-methyltransferase YrrM